MISRKSADKPANKNFFELLNYLELENFINKGGYRKTILQITL